MAQFNRVLLIDPKDLHRHEEVDEAQVLRVMEMLTDKGQFHPPVLVDYETRVILDGHHRWLASQKLGCRRIPCYCVDYLKDDRIILESWREDISVTKEDVLRMGLSDETYPLKTTRHIYDLPKSIEPIPIELLVES